MSRNASSREPASMSGSKSAKMARVCLLTATYLWKSAGQQQNRWSDYFLIN